MIQVHIGVKKKILFVFPSSEGFAEVTLSLKVHISDRIGGTVRFGGCFPQFHAALECLCAALTDEFQPGLLCFRNALGGMVFAQALCMAEQMFFRYSSSVEGLSDVEGRLISLSL